VGLAGLPAAALVKFGLKDPVRGGFDSGAGAGDAAPPFSIVFKTLAAKPSFWLLSFGAASGSILGYGLIFWLPSFFARSFDLELAEVTWFYGSIVLIGGVIGTWLGGWLGDRVGKGNPGGYALIPAICFLLAAPAYAAGLFAPSLTAAWFLFLIPQMLGLAWLGPIIAAVQHIVPPNMRATASASFLFINNLIGIGFGTWFVGRMSDGMKSSYGDESLRYSILFTLGFYLLSSVFYFVASRSLKRDWYRPA
jgi:sugar phosphate permease